MSTAAAPARQLDPGSTAEINQAARALLAEFGTSATSPRLLERVAGTAASLGDGVRHHCRPVDTEDGLFVLRD